MIFSICLTIFAILALPMNGKANFSLSFTCCSIMIPTVELFISIKYENSDEYKDENKSNRDYSEIAPPPPAPLPID